MSSSEENNFSDSATSEYAVVVEEKERQFPRANISAKSADESNNSANDDDPHQFDTNAKADGQSIVNYEREVEKE